MELNEHINGNLGNLPKHDATKHGEWREKLAFWIFGLNYKFGFILILSAAHDIIHNLLPELKLASPARHCYEFSTGVILLANVVPAHIMLFIMPKCQNWFVALITVTCVLNIISLATIAYADNFFIALAGVAINSLAFSISDHTLAKKIVLYPSKIISIFTESSYGSCVWASLYYAGLREFNMSLKVLFLSLIPLQVIVLFSCWFLLHSPKRIAQIMNFTSEDSEFPLSIFSLPSTPVLFDEKCEYIFHLMKHVIPLGLIVLMHFFINQGLYEFIYFHKNFISIESQYRWYNCIFQVGFYACLKTKTLLVVHNIWICTVLQALLVSYFTLDAVFFFTPYLWIFVLLFYIEGIISGAAYINTMRKMEAEEAPSRLDMAENVMKQCLSLMTILGGILAIIVHRMICRIPEPNRK